MHGCVGCVVVYDLQGLKVWIHHLTATSSEAFQFKSGRTRRFGKLAIWEMQASSQQNQYALQNEEKDESRRIRPTEEEYSSGMKGHKNENGRLEKACFVLCLALQVDKWSNAKAQTRPDQFQLAKTISRP